MSEEDTVTVTPEPSIEETAMAVAVQAEPDDDFEGQFVDYLVPAEAIHALRAALVRAALEGAPHDPE